MNTNIINLIVVALIAVLFMLTAYQGYENHLDFTRRWEIITKMTTDPYARPDAWTRSDDDRRTLKMCVAILLSHPSPAKAYENLPKICRKEGLKHGTH
jgi:hypothetical protein